MLPNTSVGLSVSNRYETREWGVGFRAPSTYETLLQGLVCSGSRAPMDLKSQLKVPN